MTHTPTPAEIETLRKIVNGELDRETDYAAIIAANKTLDRLSPAPEVDEATVWTRKALEAEYGGQSYLAGAWDDHESVTRARAVIADLIASKDAEIELERGRFKIADEEVDNLRRELVAVRAEKADFLWRRRADYTVAELATLQAENERLKDTISDLGVDLDEWQRCERAAGNIPSPKAAERNTAEPEHRLSDESNRKAGEVVRSTDSCSSDGSGNAAPVVEVTQGDRNAAAEIWNSYVAKTGEVMAEKAIREGDSDNVMLVQAFVRYRTEAEARGRREALEEIKKWLRSPEGKGSDAGIDYADGFADQIERMMTGGK